MAKKKSNTRSTPRTLPGYVYFALARELSMVKIGWAETEPNERLQSLQTGSPVVLERLALVRGHAGLERSLHGRFKAFRRHGEWFTFSAEVEAYVKEHGEPWTEHSGHERERRHQEHLEGMRKLTECLRDANGLPSLVYPMYHDDVRSGRPSWPGRPLQWHDEFLGMDD